MSVLLIGPIEVLKPEYKPPLERQCGTFNRTY